MGKSAKANAWKMFSQLRRIECCLESTGFPFLGVCITCGKRYHIAYLEAGHCFSGRGNERLISRKLVNNQCGYCNRILHGDPKKYRVIMEDKYGQERVEGWHDRYKRLKGKVVNVDWSARVLRYKKMLRVVLNKHGYKTWLQILQDGRED